MKKSILFLALVSLLFLNISCGGNKNVNVFPVKMGDNWGYVNTSGKFIVNPTLDSAGLFYCGVARVVKDKKVGYINPSGKYIIEPVLSQGTGFSENKAFVVREGGPITCINTDGEDLFTLENTEYANVFSEDRARIVDASGKTGFIGTDGKISIEPQYIFALDFSEGLVKVFSDEEAAYIDKNGDKVFSVNVQSLMFSEGLVRYLGDNGRFGFINKKGEVVIPHQFVYAGDFHDGLALAQVDKYGHYGFIDKKGNFAINPKYRYASSFYSGRAIVEDDNDYGYINTSGRLVIKDNLKGATHFIGNYAFARGPQKWKWGIINKRGRFVVEEQFDEVGISAVHSYVRCEKFIGKEFVPAFLKKCTSDGWDGLSANTNLGEIRKNYSPKKYDYGDDRKVYSSKQNEEIGDGVKVTLMEFGFDSKIYESYYDWSSWQYKKKWYDSKKLKSLKYTFSLSGIFAADKASAVAAALAEGIAKMYGVIPEVKQSSIVIPPTDKTAQVELVWSKNNEFYMKVLF